MKNVRPASELERYKKNRHWLGISVCSVCKKAFQDRVYCTKAKALAFNGDCPECVAEYDTHLAVIANQGAV